MCCTRNALHVPGKCYSHRRNATGCQQGKEYHLLASRNVTCLPKLASQLSPLLVYIWPT
jgi:hypothetical protein